MTFVPQKPKHCFVACVVSSLEDKGLRDEQSKVVDQFPKELQKGLPDEGVPKTRGDFIAVVTKLGLAHTVDWIDDTAQIKNQLLANKNVLKDMYLMTRNTGPTTNHCVRIKRITDDGVEVMNPESGFETWDWATINSGQCRLAIFLSVY